MTKPAKAGYSGNLDTTLARDWAFQVKNPKDEKWKFVRGLSKFSPKRANVMKDDSDIDSEGYKSQIATATQLTFEGEGQRKGTLSEGTFKEDEGQAIIREAGGKMGLENVVEARCWRTDGVQEAYHSRFSVDYTVKDGGNEDLDMFSFSMIPPRVEHRRRPRSTGNPGRSGRRCRQ